jgi:hypothetical protein
VLPALSAGLLLVLAYALSATRGWGCVALAVTIIAFVLAIRTETRGRDVAGGLWLAERKGLGWLMLPFAAVNWWATGLAVLAAYAAASFFWAQRHAHGPAAPARQD